VFDEHSTREPKNASIKPILFSKRKMAAVIFLDEYADHNGPAT